MLTALRRARGGWDSGPMGHLSSQSCSVKQFTRDVQFTNNLSDFHVETLTTDYTAIQPADNFSLAINERIASKFHFVIYMCSFYFCVHVICKDTQTSTFNPLLLNEQFLQAMVDAHIHFT